MSKAKPAFILSLLIFFFFSSFIFPLFSFAQNNTTEEIMTFETYYPAPFGVYNEMRAKKMAVGDNYYNGSQYCWSPATCSNQIDGATSSCFPNCNTDLVVEGNVGIGTTKPDYKMSFGPDGGGVSNILAFVDEASPNNAMRGIGAYNSGGVYGLAFWASLGDAATISNTRMFIDANTGNVGIGTASPGDTLDVYGGGQNILSVVDSASKLGVWIGHDGTRGIIRTTYWPGGSNIFTPLTFQTNNADRLYISTAGNVGIGTASPVSESVLTARGSISVTGSDASGNTGGNRLGLDWGGSWGRIWATNGGGAAISGLQIQANQGVLTLNPAGGNVGIGTTSPAGHLTVRGTGTDANGFLRLENTAGYSSSIYLMANNELRFNLNDGSSVGYLTSAGWGFASDRALKKDIVEMSKYGLDTVMLMHPREYKMKADNSPQIGFIAQEMQELIPEVISGEEGHLGITHGSLTAVLAKAIQELTQRVEQLQIENKDIKAKIALLKTSNK